MDIYIARVRNMDPKFFGIVRAENETVAKALIARWCNREIGSWVLNISTHDCVNPLINSLVPAPHPDAEVLYCDSELRKAPGQDLGIADILNMRAEIQSQTARRIEAERRASVLAEQYDKLNQIKNNFREEAQCKINDTEDLKRQLQEARTTIASQGEGMALLMAEAANNEKSMRAQEKTIDALKHGLRAVRATMGFSEDVELSVILDTINDIRRERLKVRKALSAGPDLSTDKIVDQIDLIHSQAGQSMEFRDTIATALNLSRDASTTKITDAIKTMRQKLHGILFCLNLKEDATQEEAQRRIRHLINQVNDREMDLRSIAEELGLGITSTVDTMRKRIRDAREQFKAVSQAKAAINAEDDALNQLALLLRLPQPATLGQVLHMVKSMIERLDKIKKLA